MKNDVGLVPLTGKGINLNLDCQTINREPCYSITRIADGNLESITIFSKYFGYNDWAIFLEDCYIIKSEYTELDSIFKLSELATVNHRKYNNINSRNLTFSDLIKRLEIKKEDVYCRLDMNDEAAEGLRYLILRANEDEEAS